MINNLEDGVISKITAKDGYVITVTKYQASAAFRGRLIIAGIGLSKPESLKGCKMNYLDWARLDLASLVDLS